jgi:hypothetical protein
MGSFGRYEGKDVPFDTNRLAADKAGRGYGCILVLLSGEGDKLCRADTPLCYRRWEPPREGFDLRLRPIR